MKVKESLDLESIFGDLSRKVIWSNDSLLSEGDFVVIPNSNCEFEYDSIEQKFVESTIYAFVVDLEIIDVDLTNYIPEKSSNGGKYGFASCKVRKIIEEGY